MNFEPETAIYDNDEKSIKQHLTFYTAIIHMGYLVKPSVTDEIIRFFIETIVESRFERHANKKLREFIGKLIQDYNIRVLQITLETIRLQCGKKRIEGILNLHDEYERTTLICVMNFWRSWAPCEVMVNQKNISKLLIRHGATANKRDIRFCKYIIDNAVREIEEEDMKDKVGMFEVLMRQRGPRDSSKQMGGLGRSAFVV